MASMYAFMTSSFPAKALTSMSRVLCGRWKFVISASTTLYL